MRAAAGMVVLSLALSAATSAAADPRVLALDECLRLGFAHDAGLRSQELETQIADARIHEMQGQYLPSLSLQGGYSRLSDVAPGSISVNLPPPFGSQTITFPPSLDNSTTIKLSLQQPLFTGQRIAGSIRQAEAQRDGSRGDLGKSRLDLRYSISEAFWDLAKAKTQVQAITQSVSQAQMRLEDAGIDLTGAQSAQRIAGAHLAIMVGLPWDTDIDVPDAAAQDAQAGARAPAQSLAELVAKALSSRPEILAAKSRVTASEASVDVARAGLFPSVSITFAAPAGARRPKATASVVSKNAF